MPSMWVQACDSGYTWKKKESCKKKHLTDAKREQRKEERKAKVVFILDSTNHGA